MLSSKNIHSGMTGKVFDSYRTQFLWIAYFISSVTISQSVSSPDVSRKRDQTTVHAAACSQMRSNTCTNKSGSSAPEMAYFLTNRINTISFDRCRDRAENVRC